MTKRLPAVCAVDFCRFVKLLGDALKPCDINYHHVAYLLPRHKNYKPPKTKSTVEDNACAVISQNSVEYHLPNIAEDNSADEVRHEKNGSENARTFYSNANFRGVGQAKAVIFFVLVALIALLQLRLTREKEVQQ